MTSQNQLFQLTEEAVVKQGLSGVNSLEGLELWAEKRNLSHQLLLDANDPLGLTRR